MKLRNKISRRAQFISAIVVVIVFGGGWLAVWKWPHIKLRYMMYRAGPELQMAMATRARWLTLPKAAPPDWIPLDLGIVSFSVPSRIEMIKTKDPKSVCIETTVLQICIPDFFSGREISEDFRTGTHLQLLRADGHWHDAGYVEYCHAAGFASSDDFRWSLPLEQILSLQQLLFFKAMSPGTLSEFHFDDTHSMGLMTLSPPGSLSGYEFGRATIYATNRGDHDGIVLWCVLKSSADEQLIANLISSLRFPTTRYPGTAEDLTRHMETLAQKVAATTQPAQP